MDLNKTLLSDQIFEENCRISIIIDPKIYGMVKDQIFNFFKLKLFILIL